MLTGIRFLAMPTSDQANKLSQWIGCARVIWNAKVQENEYFYSLDKKFAGPAHDSYIDQQYSQFKSESTSFLNECPSQILRNETTKWYQTMQKAFQGLCGYPQYRSRGKNDSIHLTREVFRLEKDQSGNIRLFIGTKTNNIGYLNIKWHSKNFQEPASIRIKRVPSGKWYVSFSFEFNQEAELDILKVQKEKLSQLKKLPEIELQKLITGIDRGIVIPAVTPDHNYQFNRGEKSNIFYAEKQRVQVQKKLARQQKGSKRRNKTRQRLARKYEKISNIRNNFNHHTSKHLVDKTQYQVFVLEDLKVKNMSKSAAGTLEYPGRNVKAKAGLNREILNIGWGQLEIFLKYKALRKGKIVYKINAKDTSCECADCGHTHKANRRSQNEFRCIACGSMSNADKNAAQVIKKRAVKLILDPGTGLSDRGVLSPSDTGRSISRKAGQNRKQSQDGNTQKANPTTRQKRCVA